MRRRHLAARRRWIHSRDRCGSNGTPLLAELEPQAVLADKGNDPDNLVANLEGHGIKPVIPPKANRQNPRETDFALYWQRWMALLLLFG